MYIALDHLCIALESTHYLYRIYGVCMDSKEADDVPSAREATNHWRGKQKRRPAGIDMSPRDVVSVQAAEKAGQVLVSSFWLMRFAHTQFFFSLLL